MEILIHPGNTDYDIATKSGQLDLQYFFFFLLVDSFATRPSCFLSSICMAGIHQGSVNRRF